MRGDAPRLVKGVARKAREAEAGGPAQRTAKGESPSWQVVVDANRHCPAYEQSISPDLESRIKLTRAQWQER